MTLLEVAQKFGQSRSTLSVGDKVLIEGGDTTNGNYVILCEVAAITGTDARLRECETYYISGQVSPRAGEMTCPIAYFKDSIATRLEKQNDFFRWLAEEFRK